MELCTDVKRFYRESKIPVRFYSNEDLEALSKTSESLRIISAAAFYYLRLNREKDMPIAPAGSKNIN